MKKLLSIFIVIFIIGALLLSFLFINSSPRSKTSEDYIFRVSDGMSFYSMTNSLYENRVIRSKIFFKIIGKLSGKTTKIKSGVYNLGCNNSSIKILKILIEGKTLVERVQIPEGFSAKDIAKLLDKKKVCDYDEFLYEVKNFSLKPYNIDIVGAEGFLYPDTYFLELDYGAKKLVELFVSTFFKKLELNFNGEVTVDKSFYKKVILASLVEREYRLKEEAPLIASVFRNRLKIWMPLQSCASIVYIITDILDKEHPEKLLYKDLKIESDYNTYENYGLPPTPICNPGFIALNAAINEVETDYLFFVLEDPKTGKHKFNSDFYKHNSDYKYYVKKR